MGTYSNVWDALFDDKEKAANLRIRSELMIEITKYLNKSDLTQIQAAERLGISQPRLSNLKNGKIDKFTIDMLVNVLSKADIAVNLTVSKPTDVKEKGLPWHNFYVLEGGKNRLKSIQKKKPTWDTLIHEPKNMATIG